jgi:hypothetical protein
LGGRCAVESHPGNGTRVIADVPLVPPVQRRDEDGA